MRKPHPTGCGSIRLLATIVSVLLSLASCTAVSSVRGVSDGIGVKAAPPNDSSESHVETLVTDDGSQSIGSTLPVALPPRIHTTIWPSDSLASVADENMQKLERLFESRRGEDTRSDFVIGTGDVLEISIPAMEQLKAVDARVLGDGTITLPLLGRVSAAGKSENELGDELRQQLRRYMYHPQLGIFVKEYQSRGVNVMGALDKPGLYTLVNPHETILSMIGEAGGLSDKAGAHIYLLPAELNAAGMNPAAVDASLFDSAISDHEQDPSDVAPDRPQRQSPTARIDAAATRHPSSASSPEAGQYLLIDLDVPDLRKYLEIPARPGDTIIVSQAGEVAVQGWVQTPGAFKITPKMTLLGAVAAAGGELFSNDARILRTDDNGKPITVRANLSKIRNREEPDIPVQAGDVVIVDKSLLGSAPYLLYTIFTKFNTGMYLPPP